MRCKPLTTTSARKTDAYGRKRLVSSYEWHGSEIEVCDSARNILSIIELLTGYGDQDDVSLVLVDRLLFDPPAAYEIAGDEIHQLIYDAMWDVCGLDVTPDGEHMAGEDGDKWFDWEEDADRIRNSLRAAYGISWDETSDNITFSEATSLITQLAEYGVNTPFQQAVHYRLGKPPSAKVVGSDAVDAWHEARDFYELKGSDSISVQNDGIDDLFEVA